MTSFSLRYDLRAPAFGKADAAALYAAALEQAEWADRLGFAAVVLSEHHGSPDGYLPSPLVMAAAIAARTRRVRISIAALIAPLHDPLRIAEDLAVVDVISNGRLVPMLSGGYVASEFAAFGRTLASRARYMEEIVPFLVRAWSGEPFEWNGRTVRVTPRPVQRPRPPILLGGSSRAAAARAARLADGFMPTLPKYFDIYREELRRLGKPDPGPMPPGLPVNFLHVAEDPERAWRRIAPHALHETNAYGKWIAEAGGAGPYQVAKDADELRASGAYCVLTPDELIARVRALGPNASVSLHPLMGGLDPELAWESLQLLESKVLPALRGDG
jgi:alkanesulfonate monooxygenase SsuD/methylene tetrahydromethanopterin reductase-like flavin-dependent oxidoreductase (luciferase family)